MLLSSSFSMAQAQQKPSIILSNYTFAKGRSEIGEVHVMPDLDLKTIRLTGPDAGCFKVERGNVISIKKQFNKPNAMYEIGIASQTAKGIISGDFRIIRDEFKRNKVIAHRGAWKNTQTPQNSLASLEEAIKLGCEGSEFDIHLSSDSVLFINHDPEFQGYELEKTPSSVLSSLKLQNAETLPTLEAFLKKGTAQNCTRLILEIKPSKISTERALLATSRVMDLVRQMKAQAWVDYISFDYNVCLAIRKADPYARVAYLNGDRSPEELKKDGIPGFDYRFDVLKKNEDWLQRASQLYLSTNAWTVNDEETMRWMLSKGIDYITTNEPELLLKVVAGK